MLTGLNVNIGYTPSSILNVESRVLINFQVTVYGSCM